MKKIFGFVVAGLLAGCASNSGIVRIGPDTYMVSRQAATGFMGLAKIKAKAFGEANAYCDKQNRIAQVTHTEDSHPPYIFGNYPRSEVQFMCLDPKDPEAGRPKVIREE